MPEEIGEEGDPGGNGEVDDDNVGMEEGGEGRFTIGGDPALDAACEETGELEGEEEEKIHREDEEIPEICEPKAVEAT